MIRPSVFAGTYPEEKQTSHIFMTGGSLQIGARHPPSEAPPLPQDQETWDLSPWMFAFRRDGSQILEETFLGGRSFTSQRSRERIYNCKFSKVNALRKKMSGT